MNVVFLFLPILCLAWIKGWRVAIGAGSVFIFALLFSPIPTYYLFTGALEVQSGVVMGVFTATLSMLVFNHHSSHQQDAPKSLLVLFMLSALLLPTYKDTVVAVIAAGFLLLVFLLALKPSFFGFPGPTKESMTIVIKYGAVPLLLGMAISLSYNMAKYGVLLPVVYLIESRETSPDLFKSIEFFLGSIFSPNGGVIIFWFLSCLIMLSGWRMLGLSPRRSVVWLGLICAVLTLLGLAKWWAPFGWDSWGDRLAIPAVLGLLVGMLLSLESKPSTRTSSAQFFDRSSLFKLLLLGPVVLVCLYYVSVPYRSSSFSAAMQASLNPGPACQNMYQVLQKDTHNLGLKFWQSSIYYDCARERMMHLPKPAGIL